MLAIPFSHSMNSAISLLSLQKAKCLHVQDVLASKVNFWFVATLLLHCGPNMEANQRSSSGSHGGCSSWVWYRPQLWPHVHLRDFVGTPVVSSPGFNSWQPIGEVTSQASGPSTLVRFDPWAGPWPLACLRGPGATGAAGSGGCWDHPSLTSLLAPLATRCNSAHLAPTSTSTSPKIDPKGPKTAKDVILGVLEGEVWDKCRYGGHLWTSSWGHICSPYTLLVKRNSMSGIWPV